MKKGGIALGLLIILILLISPINFVSADWFESIWNKATGKVTENITSNEANEIIEPECSPIPISRWCPDETTLCPMKTDEQGCSAWDCDSCEPVSDEIICCKIEAVVPEPVPKYENRRKSECPPSELLIGITYEIVSDKYCVPETPVEQCSREGETKNYICPDGTKIPECKCENGQWVCIISPEDACPEKAKPINLIYFYADICPSCIGMENEIDKVSEKLGLGLAKINIDEAEHSHLVEKYKIRAVPTLIFIQNIKENKYVKKEGKTNWEEIVNWIENSKEIPKPRPEPEPPYEVEICAAKIKVTFDKKLYYIGDTAKIVIEVLDSQGSPVPNYVFYNQVYDTMWHTAGSDRTDNEGYFRFQPTIEKEQTTLGKIKFKVYTAEYSNCNSVEDITEIEIREREKSRPVPCGMGNCIPIEEDKKEPKEISKDKVFYQCNGCELDGKCYPMGYRKEGYYCSDNSEFISQINNQCDNNFECRSNVCISGECVGEGLMKKIIKWLKKMFGGDENEEEEEPGLEICSKLLFEKDIKDNEYIKSGYGADKHSQVPVYSEDGKNIGTIKCCAADYSTGMVMVCPFDSEEEVKNSLRWVLGRGEAGSYSLGEYEGEKVIDINDGGILAWTNKVYLIASGGKPEANNKFVKTLTDAYLKRYSSDLDITEEDIPDVLNPKQPETWVTCKSDEDMLTEECHFIDDFESGLEKWTFSNGGVGYDGIGETLVEDGNTVLRLVGVERANVHRIWDNYLFKFRFKMIDGSVHVDFRRSEGYTDGARRYLVGVNYVGVYNLNKQIGRDWRELEEIDFRLDDGWHDFEIRGYGDIINVYIDNELVAKHKDTLNPFFSGWVRFEAHTGGVPGMVPELLIDDVEIRLITEDEIVYP